MKILFAVVNILIFLALAPLFEGLVRKLTAKVQSRKGPPIYQPYFDLLKLLGKDNVNSTGSWTFMVAPLVSFASIIAVVALVPFGYKDNVFTQYADVITIVYLLTMGGVAVLLGAISSKNTFAMVGASREMVTMIMVEPILAMTFILGAVKSTTLGIDAAALSGAWIGFRWSTVIMLVVYIMALQAFVAKQPFDIAEAEIEILEGPFIEYSGPNLALFKYYMWIKQMFYAFLFVVIFVPAIGTGYYVGDLALQIVMVSLVFVLIALVGSTNPRLRIDQAVKYYAFLIIVSLSAVCLSVTGF